MKKVLKNVKGITLIALVITIIVLLILAGITINMISSQDGILNKAKGTKEVLEEARKKENENINFMKQQIEVEENKWSGNVASSFEKGDGTVDNPYIIKTPEQLALLANKVNGGNTCEGEYYRIVSSMSLEGIKWTPIGKGTQEKKIMDDRSMTLKFKGNIDGECNAIANIDVDETDTWGVGLFGVIDGAIIKNITILSGNVDGQSAVGSVIGLMMDGTVDNCINKAKVTAISTNSNVYTGEEAGGVVGKFDKGSICNCINYGDVSAKNITTNEETNVVGGIIGAAEPSTNIKNCINNGNITGQQQIGGIVGRINNVAITECENNGKVMASNYLAGGIAGYIINRNNRKL